MITIRSLCKRYRQQTVLNCIDLTIPRGCIFALLGPNGSGKTTILKALLGIAAPDPGSQIVLNGESVIGTIAYKRHIGYMPQAPSFPPHLKVEELIALFKNLRGKEGIYEDELLGDLGIDRFWKKLLGELSGGMYQKVNLLQCFMFDATLFVLDEPTLGLDPRITFYLKELIRKRRANGATILFTSHVMAEVEELSDRLALLVEGKIHTVTSAEELKIRYGTATLEAALHQFWISVSHG